MSRTEGAKIVNHCKRRRSVKMTKNRVRRRGGLTIENTREKRHFTTAKITTFARANVRLRPSGKGRPPGGGGKIAPHRGILIEGQMNLSDLSPPARLYLLGYCRNDRERAKALAEVVFQGQNLRTVAKAYGLDPRALRRQRDTFRRRFRSMMRSARLTVFDLVATKGDAK